MGRLDRKLVEASPVGRGFVPAGPVDLHGKSRKPAAFRGRPAVAEDAEAGRSRKEEADGGPFPGQQPDREGPVREFGGQAPKGRAEGNVRGGADEKQEPRGRARLRNVQGRPGKRLGGSGRSGAPEQGTAQPRQQAVLHDSRLQETGAQGRGSQEVATGREFHARAPRDLGDGLQVRTAVLEAAEFPAGRDFLRILLLHDITGADCHVQV